MRRRACIAGLAAGWAAAAQVGTARAHGGPGPVSPPLPAPDLPFADHLGRPQELRRWLTGKVTAVQTIFTGCSSICPLQGALFAESQRRLAQRPPRLPVHWLSLSIDPLGDTPQSLRTWLQRMGATQDTWVAGLPRMADLDRLRRGLDGVTQTTGAGLDDHSDKVWFFDAQAQLRWRSGSLPTPDEVTRVLAYLAA